MPDTTERVIIEVGLTNADYVRKAEETIKKMDELKLQQLQLKAAGEQGGVQWQANAQAIRGLGQELKNYTTLATAADTAEKALTASTENATLAYTTETGSINELRARLSLLTQQRNAMSAAERDGSEAGQELTAQARALSDELKELEKATGDTRRNVGNYSEGMRDAIANTVPFGNEIVNAAQSAKAFTTGISSGTGALKIFKIALAGTGIGLIIIAIAALIGYLSKLKPLMDFIEQATAGLKAGFEVLGRIVFDLGKTLITALSSPLELLKDIGNFLAHPIDGFKKLGESAAAMGKEMIDAAKAAAELTARIQDQDDADRAAISNTAKLRLERDRLAVQAKNVALTEKQRIDLLERSSQKEKAAFEIEQQNAKNRLANLKEEERQFLKNNKAKEASDELLDEIAAAEAEVYNQEATSLKFTEKRYNDQAKLREKAEADAEKAAAAEEKRREKQLEADRERLASESATQGTLRTQRQNELREIEQDIADRKLKFAAYNGTVVALEQERLARIKALNKQYRKEDAEALQANLQAIEDSEIARIQNADDRELMQIATKNQRKIDAQQKLIDETYERITKGETGLTDLLLSQELLRDELLSTQRQELREKNEEIAKADQAKLYENYQKEVEFAEGVKEAKAKIKAEEAANLDAFVSLSASIFGKETAAGKAALLAEKGIAVARIVIKTQEALAANRLAEQLANASYSALGIFGIGAAAANSIKSAAERTRIIIGGALSGAAVIATTIQGFKDGVIGFDSDGMGSMVRGRGTGTSDSINARLSNGESVINARSTSLFAPLLSAINQAGGGRALDDGYKGSGFAGGGLYDGANLGAGAQASVDMQNAMMQAVSGLQVVVSVKDIINVTDEVVTAKVKQNI